jgi:hypothetical protein
MILFVCHISHLLESERFRLMFWLHLVATSLQCSLVWRV